MHSQHFQQHLERCKKWAENYKKTGSYKEIDLKSLDQCKLDQRNITSLSSQSSSSKDAQSNHSLPDAAQPNVQQFSQPSNKTSGPSTKSTSVFEPNNMNKPYRIRFNLLARLRQDLKKFREKIFEEYSEVLDDCFIEKEISNQFLNKQILLKDGFVELKNILEFAQKRPYSERRLIKMATLPDTPSMDEVNIFSKLMQTSEETILNWCDQRFLNQPRFYRSDKDQKRMSVDSQIQLMTYIYENSQYMPKRDGIKRIEVAKVKNLATRIFLRLVHLSLKAYDLNIYF